MNGFQFLLRELLPADPESHGELEIRVGNVVLTRLIRSGVDSEDVALRIPVAPVAYWVADNWWRLRWEPISPAPSESWRMAHEMTAIGHGHAWPRVTIWGDRDRVMLVARADPHGVVGPVRFLTNAVLFVPAVDFESAVDALLERACSIASTRDRKPLQALVTALSNERVDTEVARWRRLEAVCGYDTDKAPDILIDQLFTFERQYAPADVEEAVAAAPGKNTANTLSTAIEAAMSGEVVDFSSVLDTTRPLLKAPGGLEPWVAAEAAANAVRHSASRPAAPLLNRALADLVGISPRSFSSRRGNHESPYALRLTCGSSRTTVLLTAKWSQSRRFQLARAIGDAVWSNGSSLGVISSLGSARQKFQRAFAAALLCPAQGLQEFFGTDDPTDADITAAAVHYHVSEKTVRSVLVNKHLMERRRLGQPLNDPFDPSSLDEVADAA